MSTLNRGVPTICTHRLCNFILLACLLVAGCRGPENREAHPVTEQPSETLREARVAYVSTSSPHRPELVLDDAGRTAQFRTRVLLERQPLWKEPIAANILGPAGAWLDYEAAIYASGGLGRMHRHWYLVNSAPDRLEALLNIAHDFESFLCVLRFEDGSSQVELLQRRRTKEE